MSVIEENELAEVEEKLQNTIDEIEINPFDETIKTIRPQLHDKTRSVMFTPMAKRMVAAAASIILLLAVGLTVYFSIWSFSSNGEDEYTYGDDVLTLSDTIKSEVESDSILANLNLSILFNDSYQIAIHNETMETAYYKIKAYSTDGSNIRYFVLTVIAQPKYNKAGEDAYYEGDKKTILGIEMTIKDLNEFEPPFYNYRIGFIIENIRYYFDYQTTSGENDIEDFMQSFLRQ